jgi:PTH1 family peptidyl-tRNA hydrolase
MRIICGLGNPGKEYEATRHNMGFLTMDVLSSRLDIRVNRLKFRALVGEGFAGTEKVVLVKPQTYMNLSGESLREVMAFYKADPSQLLVVYDDSDIAVGSIRIRPFGSAGSHNGMKSIVYQLQTDRFPRIRIGIGKSGQIPMEKFVLGKWTEEERPLLAEAVDNAALACEEFIRSGIDAAMNKYNKKAHDL